MFADMLHYFAYGSNLHPVRLTERIPSARLVDTCILPGHQLRYHKRSLDQSGKCTLVATGTDEDLVHGAVYTMAREHKSVLDEFEGMGAGYIDEEISLEVNGSTLRCFTYYAQESHIAHDLQPYHWYKDLVILGARFHSFPEDYIAEFLDVESAADENANRNSEHTSLIERIRHFYQ